MQVRQLRIQGMSEHQGFVYFHLRIGINLRTAIGIRVKDGVVLAVEKLVQSKLLIPGSNRRIQTIDRHIGMVRLYVHSSISLGLIVSS